MSKELCFVCSVESKEYETNVSELKSQHSGTSIVEFIKKFFRDVPPRRIIADETNIICFECIIRMNEYDYACESAKRIEQDFHEMLIQSEAREAEWKSNEISSSATITKKVLKSYRKRTRRRVSDNDSDSDSEYEGPSSVYNKCIRADSKMIVKSPEVVQIHGKGLNLTCGKCKVTFHSFKDLAAHKHDQVRSPTNDGINDVTEKYDRNVRYKCYECDEKFPKKIDLITHLRVHKKEKGPRFKCGICFYVLENEDAYIEHEKLHENRSPLECVYCNKVLTKKDGLVKHMLLHSNETLYQCHKCGKTFVHVTSFDSHMNAHDDIRKQKCTICSKEFRNISHLNRHKQTHIGTKPFKCTLCEKAFAYDFNRRVHEQQHVENNGTGAPDKPHLCSFCGATYARKSKLKEHLRKNHETLVPHAAIENTLESNDVKGRSLGHSV